MGRRTPRRCGAATLDFRRISCYMARYRRGCLRIRNTVIDEILPHDRDFELRLLGRMRA